MKVIGGRANSNRILCRRACKFFCIYSGQGRIWTRSKARNGQRILGSQNVLAIATPSVVGGVDVIILLALKLQKSNRYCKRQGEYYVMYTEYRYRWKHPQLKYEAGRSLFEVLATGLARQAELCPIEMTALVSLESYGFSVICAGACVRADIFLKQHIHALPSWLQTPG